MARVSVCLLTFADHPELAMRAIDSIRAYCPRAEYELIVGANAVGQRTQAFLEELHQGGAIDHLVVSPQNLNKCPMMGEMFKRVGSELIWWFDDDSYILNSSAFELWSAAAQRASSQTAMWGKVAFCDHPDAFAPAMVDVLQFVRSATWYRGLPPPSWKLGGRGEMNFQGHGTGDGRWFFLLGGCWMIRTSARRELDWPDPRLANLGDDVFLGEAVRQRGWTIENIPKPGVAIDAAPRRWTVSANSVAH